MRKRIFFLFFCLTGSLHAEISFLENTQLSQCGINSLYLCLKYHKADVCLNEMYSNIKPDAQNDVSLKQLADYTRGKGISVKAILAPSVEDIQKSLNRDSSVILQYNTPLPDKSDFKHIVAIIKPDAKMFLLDYPKPKQEFTVDDLAKVNLKSDGLLILSKKSSASSELLNFRSLKSVSFYTIVCGILIVIATFVIGKYKTRGKI